MLSARHTDDGRLPSLVTLMLTCNAPLQFPLLQRYLNEDSQKYHLGSSQS